METPNFWYISASKIFLETREEKKSQGTRSGE